MKEYSVCIDFGGTEVKMGLFREDLMIDKMAYQSPIGIDFVNVLLEVKVKIESLMEKHQIGYADLMGLGIALPGIVDTHKKRLKAINDKYVSGIDFDIESWFKSSIGLPIIVENDANAALLGERFIGRIGDARYAIMMTLGTGVGTAVIIDGKLFRGAHYQGGCLGGHFIIDSKGEICNCGTRGCLEAQASTWVMNHLVTKHPDFENSCLKDVKHLKMKALFQYAESGDNVSKAIIEQLIDKWSIGLCNLIRAYDPEVVILSGGILQAGEIILKPLLDKVKRMPWLNGVEIKFVVSKEPTASVLYGLKDLLNKDIKELNDEKEQL